MAQKLASPNEFLAAAEKNLFKVNGTASKKIRNPSVRLVSQATEKNETSAVVVKDPPKGRKSQMPPQATAGGEEKMNDMASKSLNILTRIYALESLIKHKMDDLIARIENLERARSADVASSGNQTHENILDEAIPDLMAKQEGSRLSGPQEIELKWTPVGVRLMPPLANLPLSLQPLPLEDLATFTLEFLQDFLGGEEFSAGVYFPASYAASSPSKTHTAMDQKMKKNRIYYVLDSDLEPFAPMRPGEHGAKLNMFFRDFEDGVNEAVVYQNVPLFICLNSSEGKQFTYLGNYSQSRWSDKLSYDQMSEVVPRNVKNFWAAKLADSDKRPAWLEEKLMEAIVPRPVYFGKYPKLGSTVAEVQHDVNEYILDLGHWEEEAREKVTEVTESSIKQAFERADAAEEPGLRLQWEYLECVGFDRAFYYQVATELRRREKEGSD